MDARREGARPARRSVSSSGRALALVATLLVAFQAAEEEEVFRYDEPETVIEGLEVRAPEMGAASSGSRSRSASAPGSA